MTGNLLQLSSDHNKTRDCDYQPYVLALFSGAAKIDLGL